MGTLPSDRNNTLTTLPTNSLANKNAIIDIPDDELPEVITRLKNAPVELKDDLPPKEDDSRAASSASEGFAEDNTDEKISLNSLEVHTEARDTNEVTREGSPQERRSDEELVPRYKFSIDGVTNHIYDQLPEEGDPSFKELNKESEAACLTPQEDSSSSSSSDSEEESVLESFKEFDPEVNSEDIDCIIKEAPLEGAPPASSSEETAAHRSAKANCLMPLLPVCLFLCLLYCGATSDLVFMLDLKTPRGRGWEGPHIKLMGSVVRNVQKNP